MFCERLFLELSIICTVNNLTEFLFHILYDFVSNKYVSELFLHIFIVNRTALESFFEDNVKPKK